MASQQYRSNSGNPFFSVEDDVDDDAFLKHPTHGSAGYMFPEHQPRARNAMEDRRLQLQEERRKIEQRTVDSSYRSIGLLQESERAGIETAEELTRQREQLENTERRLDDINSTLNVSQRHINNIKSVFSSLKSYFGNRNNTAQAQTGAVSASTSASAAPSTSASQSRLQQTVRSVEAAAAAAPQPEHPGLRIRGLDDTTPSDDPYARVDAQLDQNLDAMCSGLSRLRGLAEGLGNEINDQNEMLDRISTKTDRADVRVQSQNREMQRIIKK